MSGPHATTDQLADLLVGSLAGDQAAAVETHLTGCASCASVRDQLEALPALLATTSVPPMPAAVASRLDAVLAAESARRQAQQEPPDTAVVVVPLRRLRRDRVRHWFAGAAAAAAVLLAITVVPDLVGGVGAGQDSVQSPTNGGAGAALEDSGTGAAAEQEFPQGSVPDLDSDDFGAGVELLSDSGAPAYRALSRPSTGTANDSVDGQRAEAGTTACRPPSALPYAGNAGFALARVDGDLALLVASGPTELRSVEAYSCDTGSLLAAAMVDLSR